MRAAGLLFLKDARLLRRTPALLLVLVVYPLLVALLVALALQSDERRPDVGLVVLDTSGRSVEVGGRRLSIDDYVDRLSQDVDVHELSPEAAQAALDDGRVAAVLTIPEGFISDLQSGVRPPALELTAIVLAGGAGLRVGHSLLSPGRLTRTQALVVAARQSVIIMYGALGMLLIAAAVEAFWSSQTWIPPLMKYSVAAVCWISVLSYLTLQGRRAG